MEIDPKLVLPDPSLSINRGVIHPWGADMANWYRFMLRGVARHYDFKFSTPFNELSSKVQKIILYGSGREQIQFNYEVADAESGAILISGYTQHICLDREGKVTKIPPKWQGFLRQASPAASLNPIHKI